MKFEESFAIRRTLTTYAEQPSMRLIPPHCLSSKKKTIRKKVNHKLKVKIIDECKSPSISNNLGVVRMHDERRNTWAIIVYLEKHFSMLLLESFKYVCKITLNFTYKSLKKKYKWYFLSLINLNIAIEKDVPSLAMSSRGNESLILNSEKSTRRSRAEISKWNRAHPVVS